MRRAVTGVATLCTGSSLATGQASFQGLGQYPGFPKGAFVGDISADGHVVVGWAWGDPGYQPLKWSDGDAAALQRPDGRIWVRALAVSRDGSCIAGDANTGTAYSVAWVNGVLYDNGPGANTIYVDISHDGRLVMAGVEDPYLSQTFIWDPIGGTLSDYAIAPFTGQRFATDANVICGTLRSSLPGAISTLDAQSLILSVFPIEVQQMQLPMACNGNGSVISQGAQRCSLSGHLQADQLPMEFTDMSDDGDIAVGLGNGGVCVWSALGGVLPLSCALARFGVDVAGWKLDIGGPGVWPRVSGHGLTIVGNGTNPTGLPEGWIAHLPFIPHAADFDASGFVDTDDFDVFVVAFNAGDPLADFDASGFVDTDDFDAFVHAFEEGC